MPCALQLLGDYRQALRDAAALSFDDVLREHKRSMRYINRGPHWKELEAAERAASHADFLKAGSRRPQSPRKQEWFDEVIGQFKQTVAGSTSQASSSRVETAAPSSHRGEYGLESYLDAQVQAARLHRAHRARRALILGSCGLMPPHVTGYLSVVVVAGASGGSAAAGGGGRRSGAGRPRPGRRPSGAGQPAGRTGAVHNPAHGLWRHLLWCSEPGSESLGAAVVLAGQMSDTSGFNGLPVEEIERLIGATESMRIALDLPALQVWPTVPPCSRPLS